MGDRDFPGFIGWVSKPAKALDSRSLTQMWPVFASAWTDPIGPLPGGNVQLYGPGLSIALTERLKFGLNNGGYAVADFHKNREGWLNSGAFLQYTLIRDTIRPRSMAGCTSTAGRLIGIIRSSSSTTVFNTVRIPNRLEVGVVYQTPSASEHNFHFNDLLVKMIIRF